MPNEYKLYNESDERSVIAKHLGSSPKHTIKSADRDGETVVLSDGSTWGISFGGRMTARGWSKGDEVFVVETGAQTVLVNTDTKDIAEADYEG